MFERMNEGLWKTADGRVLSPDEMDERHRYNVLAMIRRNAHRYHDVYTWDMCFESMPDPDTSAFDDLDRAFDELLYADPTEWIREFPLVKRLEKLVEG